MNRLIWLFLAATFLSLLWACQPSDAQQAAQDRSVERSEAHSADPAVMFLASLDPAQRAQATLPFSDTARETWHFVPWVSWPREGLCLDEMSEAQQEKALALLRSYLSEMGYDKIRSIMSLESVLAELENDSHKRNPEKYYVAVFGHPEKDSIWGWTFEGHHVSLHFTRVGDQLAMAPRFLGANPGEVPRGPRQGERVLADEEDLGLALLLSLDTEQREKAIFRAEAYPEVVTFHSSQVEPLDPVGLPMEEMTAQQQQQLSQLIQLYLDQMPQGLAEKRLAQLKQEEWDAVRFGWAGATELGKPHYYRIQGKTFLVEFDNSQNNANHIHVVWRDFDGDFGRDLLREHHGRDHSH